jgi:hypothetical protein
MNDGQYTGKDVAALLAPTLGEERALELVRSAIGSLSVLADVFPSRDVVRVLELIGRTEGFVGSVARFALARFTLRDANANATAKRSPSSPSGPQAPRTDALARAELTSLLAPSLGEERSDELVLETMKRLGVPVEVCSVPQGLAVLENLSLSDGLVGVAASFARAHLLLRAPKS